MKASSILICAVHPLRMLPDPDRDVMRRVLFECIRGMDAPSDAAWRRLWARIFNGEEGEGYQLWDAEPRSLKYHKRWMAIERRVFENQDFFATLKGFRAWVKTGAAHGEFVLVGDRLRFKPHSISFEDMSDAEMRVFVPDALEFLRSDRAIRRLWRHLPALQRQDMIENLIGEHDAN